MQMLGNFLPRISHYQTLAFCYTHYSKKQKDQKKCPGCTFINRFVYYFLYGSKIFIFSFIPVRYVSKDNLPTLKWYSSWRNSSAPMCGLMELMISWAWLSSLPNNIFQLFVFREGFRRNFVGKSTTQLTPIQSQPAGRDRCGNNRKCDNIDKRAHQSAGIKKQNLCYTMTFLWQYLEDWRNNLLLQSGSNKTVPSNSRDRDGT